MSLSTCVETDWPEVGAATGTLAESTQKDRIIEALGLETDRLPGVSDKTLSKYYRYLAANLSLPFRARYPEAATPLEAINYACTVLKLLDPAEYPSDDFSGIFCTVRKSGALVNLPLVELELSDDNPNFQLIEDFWYWFWNWRYP